MFKLEENNQRIGAYIRKLIRGKYDSERKFCKAYLKLQGISINDDEIRKMQNRFSQILNGKKAIQTYDLPIVTDLLGVSCEEILSAGKCYVPISSHITNYDVAFSKDQKVWQEYIDRKDKLILNYDEYGKSVLDYAFDFKNYGFLKYLTDNGYIKFRDSESMHFRYDFGADTTIKRRDMSNTDILEAKISYSNKLRMDMLTLAMQNNDFSVLDMLRARETPMIHLATLYSSKPTETEMYDPSDIIESIANAPDDVIDYFLSDYSVSKNNSLMPSCFLYQHIGDVIITMIRNHDMRVTRVIKKAIEHNNKIYSLIKEAYNDAINNTAKKLCCSKADAEKRVYMLNSFYDNCDVVKFFTVDSKKSIVANIIHADVEVSDIKITNMLVELNASYDIVRNTVLESDE